MKFSKKAAGLAAGSLMAALLVPVTLAPPATSSTDPYEWNTPVKIGDGVNPAVAAGYDRGFALAWVDSSVVKLSFLDIKATTPAWSNEVSLSAGCTSAGQPSVAMQDDSIAVAWSCDDTIQLATVNSSDLDDSLIQDVYTDATVGDPQVFLTRDFATPPTFFQGVAWVADGTTDDTVMLAGVEVGAVHIDDSIVDVAVGTSGNVSLARSQQQDRYTANPVQRILGSIVDDSILGNPFNWFSLQNTSQPITGVFAANADVKDDTAAQISFSNNFGQSAGAPVYPSVSWVAASSGDDTVFAATGPNFAGSPWGPSDNTLLTLDDSPSETYSQSSIVYGAYNDANSDYQIRTVTSYRAESGGASQAVIVVDDSRTASRDDTRFDLGATTLDPVLFYAPGPLNSQFGSFVAWRDATDDEKIHTRWMGLEMETGFPKEFNPFAFLPTSGNVTITGGSTVSQIVGVGSEFFPPNQAGRPTALIGWVEGGEVYASTLKQSTPGPNPGPNPPGPNPTPATPPSAPASAELQPGNGEVTVSWDPPASQGSFPVTNYQVQSSPSSSGCLVPATRTQCTVSGLTDGTPYAFEVRALNGGGWGSWLDAGSVTPGPVVEPSIMISGTRGDVRGRPGIIVTGSTTGIDEGSILRPWIRLPGQEGLTEGKARITVEAEGEFTWQRRTGKRIDVQIRTSDGEVRSERITIAAR